MRERSGQQRVRRRITKSSLWTTRKLGSDIVRTNVNVWRYSGIERADGITMLDQEQQAVSSEVLLSELRNISEKLAQTQQRKSSEASDILRSIADTKAVLAELYNSIGYTAGIKALGLDNEEESAIQ